jgi:hypothetical protein
VDCRSWAKAAWPVDAQQSAHAYDGQNACAGSGELGEFNIETFQVGGTVQSTHQRQRDPLINWHSGNRSGDAIELRVIEC